MGIIINTLTILFGTGIGSVVKKKFSINKNVIFGISVLIVSSVGFLENVFNVNGSVLSSENLIIIVLSLVLGYFLGDLLKIEDKLIKGKHQNAFINTTLFFAIGGMQISGSILLGISGDSSLLILKSIIDFPFALMFGSLYGKGTIFSCLPVGGIQFIIALISYFLGEFISIDCLKQLCAMGYVILFFSGYNLLVSDEKKVKNTNMLPSLLIIIVYNLIFSALGVKL